MARLERHLGLKLLTRSARGVELTEAGRRVAPRLLDVLTRSRQLRFPEESPEVVVAAPSFLWSAVARHIKVLLRSIHLHAVETSSVGMTALAGQPLFDAALSVGDEGWPEAWTKVRVGTIRRVLLATPSRAQQLGRRVTEASLRGELFVGRLVLERGQLVPSDDGCPLSIRERRFGHRAQTVAMALELARHSDQLVFAPRLAARSLTRRRALIEVPVAGWDVRETVNVVCHQDRVSARVQRALVEATRAELPVVEA
jgi:DNA-binding transcriptional LysR family regulator